jgi:hypothetical protein
VAPARRQNMRGRRKSEASPTVARKPLMLSHYEAEVLEELISNSGAHKNLLMQVQHILHQYTDDKERLDEAEVRARTNSFWDEKSDKINGMIENRRDKHKRTLKGLQDEIAHLPAKEVAEIVKMKQVKQTKQGKPKNLRGGL